MQGTALYALLHMRRYRNQLSPPKPIMFRKKMDKDPSEQTTITPWVDLGSLPSSSFTIS